MYRANITRASSGEKDNSPIIEKVLTLKQEKAKLLGYDNFAEVSMASKVSHTRCHFAEQGRCHHTVHINLHCEVLLQSR